MNSFAFAISEASNTSTSVAFSVPNFILFSTVSLNKIDSCVTIPIKSRKDFLVMFLMLSPSIKISPEFTS